MTNNGVQQIRVYSNDVSGSVKASGNAAQYYSNLAKAWAAKTDYSVDGTEYSAKYYAQQACQYYENMSDAVAAGQEFQETTTEQLESINSDIDDLSDDLEDIKTLFVSYEVINNNNL